MSGSARSLWIEITAEMFDYLTMRSGSARSLWIEISPAPKGLMDILVGLREEPVD